MLGVAHRISYLPDALSPVLRLFSIVEQSASPSCVWLFKEPLLPLPLASLLWWSPRHPNKCVINIICFRSSSFHRLPRDLSRKKKKCLSRRLELSPRFPSSACMLFQKTLCVFFETPLITNVISLPSFTDHWPQTKLLVSSYLQIQLPWLFSLSVSIQIVISTTCSCHWKQHGRVKGNQC